MHQAVAAAAADTAAFAAAGAPKSAETGADAPGDVDASARDTVPPEGYTLHAADIRHVSSELLRMLLLAQGPCMQQLLQLLHEVGYSQCFCLLHHAAAICSGDSPVLQQQLQRLLQQQLQQTVDMPLQEGRSELLLALLQQRKYAEARQWARLAGLGTSCLQLVTVHEVAECLTGLRNSSTSGRKSRGPVEERLDVWARCYRLFAIHQYPTVLAAVFLLSVSSQMEGDISLAEQALLLAAALSLLGAPHPNPPALTTRDAIVQQLISCAQGSCTTCRSSSSSNDSSNSSSCGGATGAGGLTLIGCLPLQPEEMRSVFWVRQAETASDAHADDESFCCLCSSDTDTQKVVQSDEISIRTSDQSCCRCLVSPQLLAQLQGRLLLLLTSQSTVAAATAALTPELTGSLWEHHAAEPQLLLHGTATPLPACHSSSNVQRLLERLQQLVDPEAPALPLHHLAAPQWPPSLGAHLEAKDICHQQQHQEKRAEESLSLLPAKKSQGRATQQQPASTVLLGELQQAVHHSISIGCTHIARSLVGSFLTLLRGPHPASAAGGAPNTKSIEEEQQRQHLLLLQSLSQEVQLAELLLRVVTLPIPLKAQQQQLVLLQTLSAAAAAACASTRPDSGSLPQPHRDLLQMLQEHVGSPTAQEQQQQRKQQQEQEAVQQHEDSANQQQRLLSLQMHRQQLQLLSQLVQRCKPGLHEFCLELLVVFAVSLVLVSPFNAVLKQQQQRPEELLLRLLLACAFPTSDLPKITLCMRFAAKLTRDGQLQQQQVAAVLLAAFIGHQKQHSQVKHMQCSSSQQGPQQQQRVVWFEWPLLLLKDFLRVCEAPGLAGAQALELLLQQERQEMERAQVLQLQHVAPSCAAAAACAASLPLLHEQEVEVSLLAFYDLERACNAAGLLQLLQLLQRRLEMYMQLGKPYLLLRVLTTISPSPHFKPAIQ
ncbi:hypothetical protein ETH_00017325 [Eimeria tenella]|uniref:Uncharacterized protein n=1 Tax=Eimeria tenella TaxID=5802 RepID=U6KY39_EIMTE|nr:hypothetical protein ETH_00017325 [Eimeria tenella]CDJ42881.1 hypothetical protein ETH_00017325 [Eimeria tenella]|eukprot:XP_013233631.1 hypothetical protein ETH_00017325 [Eimeria tenella]